MTGANPAHYLPGVIDWLERGLAMARRLADEREPDQAKRCFAYNHLVDALGLRFTEKFGARVGARGDIVRVQACGVVGTSIMSAADIEVLADLPSRETLLAQFAGALSAPRRGRFARRRACAGRRADAGS